MAEIKIVRKKAAPKRTVLNRIKLLVGIVNRQDDVKFKEILEEASAAVSCSFAATGTARSSVLDYLGIGQTEKSVVLSLFPERDEEAILREIRAKMTLYLVGRGIAFTVPLTGISEIVANGLLNASVNKNSEVSFMDSESRKYDLIVAIVAENFVDEAVDVARSAGAAGGTIIRSRSLGNAKAEQFIGITLTVEQEILLILAKKDHKLAIMQALSDKVGVKTEAGGVIFSLPVDRTAGISVADEEGVGSSGDGK